MLTRFHRFAVPVALTLLTATQALGATFGQIVYTPTNPLLQIHCYTRVFFTSTNSQIFSRKCDAGEKPGSVKVTYVG